MLPKINRMRDVVSVCRSSMNFMTTWRTPTQRRAFHDAFLFTESKADFKAT